MPTTPPDHRTREHIALFFANHNHYGSVFKLFRILGGRPAVCLYSYGLVDIRILYDSDKAVKYPGFSFSSNGRNRTPRHGISNGDFIPDIKWSGFFVNCGTRLRGLYRSDTHNRPNNPSSILK